MKLEIGLNVSPSSEINKLGLILCFTLCPSFFLPVKRFQYFG